MSNMSFEIKSGNDFVAIFTDNSVGIECLEYDTKKVNSFHYEYKIHPEIIDDIFKEVCKEEDAEPLTIIVDFDDNESTERKKLNTVIRKHARRNGIYREIWNKLYEVYSIYYNVDIKEAAKNKGLKSLDYAEKSGFISKLLGIAVLLFA